MDIEFDDLREEVKHAYLAYHQLYWLQTFKEARDSFDLSYTYYILPDSETESDIYIIDGTYPTRADHIQLMAENPEEYPAAFDHPQGEEAEYLYLGDQVPNARAEYGVKWAAWDSGKPQDGFQTWDNDYGKTYAYYVPVIIDGQKMGLIGAEIDIESVNTAILRNTLRQFLVIGLIFMGGLLLMMVIFNRHIISRITRLEANVKDYSKTKDAYVAQEIRKNIRGRDEIGSLSEDIAKMIEDIRDYIESLTAVNQELDNANSKAERLSELAMRDGLTGIRNRTAYKQEVDRLEKRVSENGIEYAIAVIDMNNLKKFNDVYGHDKGNEAIIKLTSLVCVTFKHSPVFRIGGDEFVAILMNDDFANREKLLAEMYHAFDEMEKDESLSPWQKISAAVGLAVYDREKDTSADDVFKRADEKMYEKKKTMKSRDS